MYMKLFPRQLVIWRLEWFLIQDFTLSHRMQRKRLKIPKVVINSHKSKDRQYNDKKGKN